MSAPLLFSNMAAPLRERGDDLYETPPEAVHALLKVEPIPLTVWEPACGPGAIVGVLRETGRAVVAEDLKDYNCPDSVHGQDFLNAYAAPDGVPCILTNPPFKLADQFVNRATDLVPLVVMLLRLEYLAAERKGLLDQKPISRIYAFKKRLPMMHRHGWEGPKTATRMNFAWFVWDRAYEGPTILERITWE